MHQQLSGPGFFQTSLHVENPPKDTFIKLSVSRAAQNNRKKSTFYPSVTGCVHRAGAKEWCSSTAGTWGATGPSVLSRRSMSPAPGFTGVTTRYGGTSSWFCGQTGSQWVLDRVLTGNIELCLCSMQTMCLNTSVI